MSGYRPDNGFDGLMAKVRQELREASGQPKPATTPKPVPQNMNTVEEPKLEAEDVGVEDYSGEDLNSTPPKPAPKSQSKDDEKYAVREVPDTEVQNPAPAKESKGGLYLCNNCFTTFRNTEGVCTKCRSNIVEMIAPFASREEDSKGKKLPPPKRMSDKERADQRKKNHAAITGGSSKAQEGVLTPGLKDADVVRKYTASVAQVGEDRAIQQTAQDLNLSTAEVKRIVDGSKTEKVAVDEKGWFYRQGDALKADPKFQQLLRKHGPKSAEVEQYVVRQQGTTTTRSIIQDLIKYAIGELEESRDFTQSEKTANAVAAALQPLGYWHAGTRELDDGEMYEFIGSDLPDVHLIVKSTRSPEED